ETGPVSKGYAENLDKEIRKAARSVAHDLDELVFWVAEAKALGIHTHLGFDSWTDYIVEALGDFTGALGPAVRQLLVDMFRKDGMSLRAIAEALGISKSTVQRQVSQSGTGDDDGEVVKTTGTDNKAYPRRSHGGGGHRGPLDAVMKLKRAGSAIANITGLEPDEARKQTAICELIEDLLASIQPGNQIELDGTELING
ncbi:RNA polymerase sigma factor, partial [Mycobacterium sp. 852002-51163_SCH5372311]|uniref:RNA polymerase sigma factor n=1 Tax=Mycobacterium sp. 852002-51163_SCH5372311 TaxID=1834097 RepID=UPI000B1CD117